MIIVFMGEYHQKIDEKGRLIIPAKIRESLGNDFIVTRGLDGCLFIYSKTTWDEIIKKYQELPNVKDTRNFMRFFLSGAINLEFDKQGRINISSPLTIFKPIACFVVAIISTSQSQGAYTKESSNLKATPSPIIFDEKTSSGASSILIISPLTGAYNSFTSFLNILNIIFSK